MTKGIIVVGLLVIWTASCGLSQTEPEGLAAAATPPHGALEEGTPHLGMQPDATLAAVFTRTTSDGEELIIELYANEAGEPFVGAFESTFSLVAKDVLLENGNAGAGLQDEEDATIPSGATGTDTAIPYIAPLITARNGDDLTDRVRWRASISDRPPNERLNSAGTYFTLTCPFGGCNGAYATFTFATTCVNISNTSVYNMGFAPSMNFRVTTSIYNSGYWPVAPFTVMTVFALGPVSPSTHTARVRGPEGAQGALNILCSPT